MSHVAKLTIVFNTRKKIIIQVQDSLARTGRTITK